MLSRRRLLTGAGITLVGGAVGAHSLLKGTSESYSPSPVDWPMAQYDPAGTGYNPDATGPTNGVRVAWEHDAPDWFRGGTTQPIRLGDTLYAVGNGLLTLDVNGGERRFGRPGPYVTSPTAGTASAHRTPTLAMMTTDGITGLDAGGGFDVPGLERRFGIRRWSGPEAGTYQPRVPYDPTVSSVSVDGTVYALVPGTNDIAALDANDGSVRWRATVVEDDVEHFFGRPTVRGGTVFVANGSTDRVSAYDREDGTKLWQRAYEFGEIGSLRRSSPATDAGVVISSTYGVALLEADTGDVIWKRELEGTENGGEIAIAEGAIFLSHGRRFHALDLETGESLWSASVYSAPTPVVADGMVYTVGGTATLLGLEAETGAERFRYEPSETVLSPAIVGDGRLYVVTSDRVVALEEADESQSRVGFRRRIRVAGRT